MKSPYYTERYIISKFGEEGGLWKRIIRSFRVNMIS